MIVETAAAYLKKKLNYACMHEHIMNEFIHKVVMQVCGGVYSRHQIFQCGQSAQNYPYMHINVQVVFGHIFVNTLAAPIYLGRLYLYDIIYRYILYILSIGSGDDEVRHSEYVQCAAFTLKDVGIIY